MTKYGWACDAWDDEYLGVAFASIDDAFADAQATFDDEARSGDAAKAKELLAQAKAAVRAASPDASPGAKSSQPTSNDATR